MKTFSCDAYRRCYLNVARPVSKASVNWQDSDIIVKSIDQSPKTCESTVQSTVQSSVQSMVQSSPESRYGRHPTAMVSKTCFTTLTFAILSKDLHKFVPVNFAVFTNYFFHTQCSLSTTFNS